MSVLSREIELYDFSIGLHHWRYTDAGRENTRFTLTTVAKHGKWAAQRPPIK